MNTRTFSSVLSSLAVAALGACATGDNPAGDPSFDGLPDAAPPVVFVDAAPPPPSPDAAPTPTEPTPDAAPEPTPGPCTQQLLTNGNFDSGAVAWSELSSIGEPVIRTPPQGMMPASGTYVAWLGGYDAGLLFPSGIDAVYQRIDVPANTIALEVRGQRRVASQEGTASPFDVLFARIVLDDGQILELLSDPAAPCSGCTWSNTHPTTDFVPFTLKVQGNYAGQSRYLHFQSEMDLTLPTSFYLDDVEVVATVCNE